MLFKQIILTGLVAAVAAHPTPRANELATSLLNQRMLALTGMSPISSVVSGEGQDVFIGDQKSYYCGLHAKSVSEQGLACALYSIDHDDNNRMMYVEGNPKLLHGKLTSGENVWEIKHDDRNRDLSWNNMEPMNINEANTFSLTLTGEGTDGLEVVDHHYKHSVVAGEVYSSGERATAYNFGPLKYNEIYDMICVYVAIPQC
eukprot:Clim_evm2s100 gene=Clim_evmTU2s100